MALSAFGDKTHQPNDADLRSTVGAAHPAWADHTLVEYAP